MPLPMAMAGRNAATFLQPIVGAVRSAGRMEKLRSRSWTTFWLAQGEPAALWPSGRLSQARPGVASMMSDAVAARQRRRGIGRMSPWREWALVIWSAGRAGGLHGLRPRRSGLKTGMPSRSKARNGEGTSPPIRPKLEKVWRYLAKRAVPAAGGRTACKRHFSAASATIDRQIEGRA
jgi:hypothetical protein